MMGLGINKGPSSASSKTPAKSAAEKAKQSQNITFQVISDLHLEADRGTGYSYKFKNPAKAKYLILGGDIGSLASQNGHQELYRAFLVRQCSAYERVFLILGNRDFNPPSVAEGVEIARGFAVDPEMNGRLTYMEQDRYDFEEADVTLLGCTLWSRIRSDQPNATPDRISGNSLAAHNTRFEESYKWLKDEVKSIRDTEEGGKPRRILVLTHYAPTIRNSCSPTLESGSNSWSKYQNDILGGEGVEGLGSGDVWVFGHTDWSVDFKRDFVRVYANQRGGARSTAASSNGFDAEKTIEV